MAKTRSPIVAVLGHVDHGKSSILDAVRRSDVTAREAGAITQAIGCSIVPISVVKERCGPLLERFKLDFKIPGLLFIDTPGHAAFTSLRKRGGALADIAVLVVDINEGFKPQTVEAVEILKNTKTPFVVAANKLDLVPGYEKKAEYLLEDLKAQPGKVSAEVDNKVYQLVGELHDKFNLLSERYDRVSDFTKQVAIIPCSAKTSAGIPELLMMVAGLSQKYLEQNLKVEVSGPARGTVLEVKEAKGLGVTADVILYDGTLSVNDTVIIGGLEEPVVTKVRALLEPAPLTEMRDSKARFVQVRSVSAATGVKISAPGLEKVLAGMPLVSGDVEKGVREVQSEVEASLITDGKEGVVVKADSIGSLEAVLQVLKERGIPVCRATVGSITKKDIAAAEASGEKNPLHKVIVGFNVEPVDACEVKVITSNVIYKLVEELEEWQGRAVKEFESKRLGSLTKPCKVEFLKGYTFRQSNPAIIGVEVLKGTLRTGTPLMNEQGVVVGVVKSVKSEQENVSQASKGERVAVALQGAVVGRNLKEGESLLSSLSEGEFRKLKELKGCLSEDELSVMREVASVMRKDNPVWGV